MAPKSLVTPHGALPLPAFVPDGTAGVVRAVDTRDLRECGVGAIMMSTFHLMQRPGSSTIRALGGLHRLCAWDGPIFADSGGFQAYSWARQTPKHGGVDRDGFHFRPEGAERDFRLTPEKTVQLQLGYGADVVFCLDECTHPDDPPDRQRDSVERTLDWSRRGREEFDRLLAGRSPGGSARPLLFAVIQGGASRDLRRRCAQELLAIGFDGFGYGGWPIDSEGRLMLEMLAFVREQVPADRHLHALGIGHPASLAACSEAGYSLFDSAMPTRDARHGRLYVFRRDPATGRVGAGDFEFMHIVDRKHVKAASPVSPHCDCFACRQYSVAYLHHLFRQDDPLYPRLATIHNLRFVNLLLRSFTL